MSGEADETVTVVLVPDQQVVVTPEQHTDVVLVPADTVVVNAGTGPQGPPGPPGPESVTTSVVDGGDATTNHAGGFRIDFGSAS